jgi:uncharacterized OsmC-like protein
MKTMNIIAVENIVRHIFNKNNVKISSIKVEVSEPATELDPDWVDPQYEVEVKVGHKISDKKYKKLMIDVERKSDVIFVDIVDF